jgi:hypothetical protein
MKSFNVQSLWDTIHGPSAGVPDYVVKKAQESNSPLKLNAPDGRFMIIEVKDLPFPYKISDPIPNRNFPSVGDVEYRYYNYLFIESVYSSLEDQPKEELLEEGSYNSFEDLKKINRDREAAEAWSKGKVMPVETVSETKEYEIEVVEPVVETPKAPKYTIKKEVVITTKEDVPATLGEFIADAISSRRKELNLSEKEVVARIVENNPAHHKFSLNNYEFIEGGSSNPKMKTLELICEALDLHISEIFPIKN